MELILLWLIFSVMVGFFANSRGRNALLWGIISFVFSPLLGVVVLLVLSNSNEEKIKMEESARINRLKISGKDVVNNIEEAHQLFVKGIFTSGEYENKKGLLISELKNKIIEESPETFLTLFIPLLDKQALSLDDINEIKLAAYNRNDECKLEPVKTDWDICEHCGADTTAFLKCPKCGTPTRSM